MRQYHERVHELLERELRELDHRRPTHAADQLLLLIDGTLAVGATRPDTHPAATARQLAEQVLGDRRRSTRRTDPTVSSQGTS